MTHRSGQYQRIDRAAVDRLRAELDAALPPLPRPKRLDRQPRSATVEPTSTQHGEFLAAYRALISGGWTLRAIARHLGISHRYVIDLRDGNRSARTEGRDWVQAMWGLLVSTDPVLPSGTGW